MRVLIAVLAVLLLKLHFELWIDDNGVRYASSLREELQEQLSDNNTAKERNDQLSAELADLADGTEVVEEWARQQRGMLRPGEVLVQYTNSPLKP
jgi:cell division protein FtsB